DYQHCDISTLSGCQRCKPKVLCLCCDLCNPEAFSSFQVLFQKPPKGTSKSVIKPYNMASSHQLLTDALLSWCQENTISRFGKVAIHTYGVRLFLANSQLTRIVDCAQSHKILTVEQLIRETGWRKELAEEYGQSILTLIIYHFPPPTESTPRSAMSATHKCAPPICSACNTVGHTSTL
ncbi:hypothetical protein BDQ17DRAFT_1251072, partial [Cyathus striatus]